MLSNNLKINSKKIYVICPPNSRTGGPELLHQLVFTLRQYNKDANIVYTDINNKKYQILDEYRQYISNYLLVSEIEDSEDNLIIVPEVDVFLLKSFSKIQKAIWWLSVNNFFTSHYSLLSLKYMLKRFGFISANKSFVKQLFVSKKRLGIKSRTVRNVDYNFCQCEYAFDFCKKYKLKNPVLLFDYINDTYTTLKDISKKEKLILYNPKKGVKITKKIIKDSKKKFTFVPLVNLTRAQVNEYMEKAMIYIDFGYHPGKDRMPREAALKNCCVITGQEGSANSKYNDILISQKFKFKRPLKQTKEIIQLLDQILNNYDKYSKEFEAYRNKILTEKDEFINQVRSYFIEE